MKLAGLFVAALIAMLMAAAGASAEDSSRDFVDRDRVAGTGMNLERGAKAHVNASVKRDGSAKGWLRFEAPDTLFGTVDIRARVSCIEADDRFAVVAAEVPRDGSQPLPRAIAIGVMDNDVRGRPPQGSPPDTFAPAVLPAPPDTCPPQSIFTGLALTADRGNFVVHDGAGHGRPIEGADQQADAADLGSLGAPAVQSESLSTDFGGLGAPAVQGESPSTDFALGEEHDGLFPASTTP